MTSKTPELDAQIAADEKRLGEIEAQKAALQTEARAIMQHRNSAIAARELHLRLNPTPVVGLPNQERLAVLRAQIMPVHMNISAQGTNGNQ